MQMKHLMDSFEAQRETKMAKKVNKWRKWNKNELKKEINKRKKNKTEK